VSATETAPNVERTAPNVERRLRVAGVLLILGLLIEGATLFALDRPVGFLTFAGLGGALLVVGIVYYLWSIVP
jgi:hypothetical protein